MPFKEMKSSADKAIWHHDGVRNSAKQKVQCRLGCQHAEGDVVIPANRWDPDERNRDATVYLGRRRDSAGNAIKHTADLLALGIWAHCSHISILHSEQRCVRLMDPTHCSPRREPVGHSPTVDIAVGWVGQSACFSAISLPL